MSAFGSLIKSAAVSTDKKGKKKDDGLVVELPTELSGKLVEFNKQKKAMKEAETAMRVAETPIILHCRDEQNKNALKGSFYGSFNVKDGDEVSKFVSSDSFSVSQDPEVHSQLKQLLGDETYGEVIQEETSVTMKADVFTDEAKQNEFIALMGDRFGDFFESTVVLKVKSGFQERMYQLAKTEEKLVEISSLITQKKPFLK